MNEIIIDGSAIFTSPDLHDALSAALSFPAHYGKNLDALYDCLTEISSDTHLQLRNWHHIEFHLKDYSGKAVYVFHCAQEENPHLSITLVP
jgi:ribonuclease inhibitor